MSFEMQQNKCQILRNTELLIWQGGGGRFKYKQSLQLTI